MSFRYQKHILSLVLPQEEVELRKGYIGILRLVSTHIFVVIEGRQFSSLTCALERAKDFFH